MRALADTCPDVAGSAQVSRYRVGFDPNRPAQGIGSTAVTARREDSSFASGVASWRESLGKIRDAVRQELVTRQLVAHLPPASETEGTRVLDVGCGQGTQAIRLAQCGYHVTGVDLSDELLEVARQAAATEPEQVAGRLCFEHGDLLALRPGLAERFDVVCCRGVLMYLPSLTDGVAAVARAARPGGLVSVLTRNRAGIAMRAGRSRDFSGALAGFDARYYRNRLGIDAVRADEPAEVAAALEVIGANRVVWPGPAMVTIGVRSWSADMPPCRGLRSWAKVIAFGANPRAPRCWRRCGLCRTCWPTAAGCPHR